MYRSMQKFTINKVLTKTTNHYHRSLSSTSINYEKYKCKLLVVGGGTGGCAMAAKMTAKLGKNNVIVLEPNDKHYYQPMFTMIGGGMKQLNESYRMMKNVLPKNAQWIKDSAIHFDPNKNMVKTKNNDHTIEYDYLIIAVGLKLNYDKIKGLREALEIPNGNVTSIYSSEYVERHLKALERFEKGNIIFTYPMSPVKCPGAPQKIFYITEHYLRKKNKIQNSKLYYNTALSVIFGVKYFADALWTVVKQRNLNVNLGSELIEIIAEKNLAIFQNVENVQEKTSFEYSILHVVPPQSPPDVILNSNELRNAGGFIDVDRDTLQHVRYSNVFAIGDCSSSPNSKTAAAAAAQADIIEKNLTSLMNNQPLTAIYDGYASCPLVTGYNTCILAEFDYNLKPLETFPFAQNTERFSMFLLKKYFMPILYWNLMLPGLWNGPKTFRKLFSFIKFK